MNKSIVEIFKPGIVALNELAGKYEGMEITDKESYDRAKVARKELGDMRIKLTKFGKSKRDKAIKFQREVNRQEKEHVGIITKVEDDLKEKIAVVDEKRKREERVVLLPMRKELIKEIDLEMTDEEILEHDEKSWSAMYTENKMAYLEAKERKRQDEAEAAERKAEIAVACADAAEKARKEAEEKADREKREEVARIEREKKEEERAREEVEANRILEEAAAKRVEEDRKAKLEADQKYQRFLEHNEYDENTDIIQEVGDEVRLYRIVNTMKR